MNPGPENSHGEILELLLERDPALRQVAGRAGELPSRPGTPGFEGLAYAVVGQLVSRRSADAIWEKLNRATGPLTPRNYVAAGEGFGPRLGLTAAKADTLLRVARAILSGELDLDWIEHLPAEQAISQLVRIKGIGEWTAEVHLLFNAGHPDIFPAGDLALRVAVGHALDQNYRNEPRLLRAFARRWAPHRSVAARLFWAYYGQVVRPGTPFLP